MSLFRMLKRSLGLYLPNPLWNALPIVQLASVPIREMWRLGRVRSCTNQSRLSKGWSIIDRLEPGRLVKGYDMISWQQFLTILQVCWNCLAGRENCFQQSDRLVGHVCEGLHPDSVGL